MRCRRMLAEMLYLKMASPAERRKIGTHNYAPVWHRGDVPALPAFKISPRRPTVALLTFWHAMQALSVPCTRREMMEHAGINADVVGRKLISCLHSLGEIHVASWSRHAHMPVEDWLLGPGPDAPRPAALTRRQQSMRHAARRRQQYQRSKHLKIVRALAGVQTVAQSQTQAA